MSGLWRKVFVGGALAEDSARVLEHLTAIPHWANGLDTVTCPVGKYPGKARFLVRSERISEASLGEPITLRLQTGNTAKPGDESDFEFLNWIITGYYDAIAVQGIRPVVIELADPRWVFRNSAYAKQYNIRYPLGSRYEPDSLKEGAPWTWREIFQDLWDAVPSAGLITEFDIASPPETEPENINVLGEPAWDALCRLVHQQGLEIFYDPFLAKITIDEITGPLQLPTVEKKVAQTGDIPSGLEQAHAPDIVKVFFPKRAQPEAKNWLPHEVEAGGLGGGKGDAVAWSDLTVETDEDGVVIEPARIQLHADQIANKLTDRKANNAKGQSIRYVGWDEVAPLPGTTEIRWYAQPFPQIEIMLRVTDPPIVAPVINQSGTSLIFKLTEYFDGREGLIPTSKVCDVYGLDTETSPEELVAETWSNAQPVKRRIYYAGTSPIAASNDHPKYLKAVMDYAGNYWLPDLGAGGTIMGEITAVTVAGGSGGLAPYSGLKIATVTVKTAPCDRVDLVGSAVLVVDHSGCVLDIEDADLIGLNMWASEGVSESLSNPGEITPCHWCADDRCCTSEGL